MNNRMSGISSENAIPILVEMCGKNIELLLSFIGTDNIKRLPPHLQDIAVEYEGEWVAPALVGARILVGPLMENIPVGDGGIAIPPYVASLVAKSIDIPAFLATYREHLDDDSDGAQIIDAFLLKYRGY